MWLLAHFPHICLLLQEPIMKEICYLRLKLFVYAPEPFRSVYIRKDNCDSRHIYKSCDISVAFIFLNWLYMNFYLRVSILLGIY